ncbi:MAG: PP2C family serine/threonine-protein phosphatase [Oscillospiraceae bacterium]|nr:PP2C family serine/threonine-protein phosphatase [Oscillospiraceae bacterium]
MFIGLNETVRGASHVDNDTVCQDYSSYKVHDHFAVAAVADGHGSKKHFRSDVGAKAAVEISIKAVEEFCAQIDEFEEKLREDPGHILTKIQKYIITHWYDAVNKHYNEHEVRQEERTQLTDEELEAIKTESIYGTTIIVGVITDNMCFGLQLGDGSLVVIKQCGESYMPIMEDESCPANLTASLCNSNAIRMFNYFYDYDLPLSILVSTDGLFTSFSSKDEFEEYNCLVTSQLDEIDVLKDRINKNFLRRTNSGSRDDISIAIIFEKDMFDENNRNVKMQVDINKNKAAIRDAEQKAKMLKRRAKMEQIRRENELIKKKEAEEKEAELRRMQMESLESAEEDQPDDEPTPDDSVINDINDNDVQDDPVDAENDAAKDEEDTADES